MADYILNGWENKDLWVLNNATWIIYHEEDCLQTGDGISGGYGEREFTNLLNNDWKFEIEPWVTILPPSGEGFRGADMQVFLDGDPNPIIFRVSYHDPGSGYWTLYIIYNGVIKDSKSGELGEGFEEKIYRIGSIYYFTNYGLSFNYGSTKKPVKLKLATSGVCNRIRWIKLKWYYTKIEQDQAFIM